MFPQRILEGFWVPHLNPHKLPEAKIEVCREENGFVQGRYLDVTSLFVCLIRKRGQRIVLGVDVWYAFMC